MSRNLTVSLAIAMLMFVLAPLARADTVTVTFRPGEIPPSGVTFSNSPFSFYPGLFLQDDYGIRGPINGSVDPATIFFTTPVSDLSITWTNRGSIFLATAYDASNNVLSIVGAPDCNCEGVASLAGSDISYVTWYGTPGPPGGYLALVGIDSLTFTQGATAVPEPSSLLLLGAGLMGLVGLLRRKISVCP